jgi:hypothetical protein
MFYHTMNVLLINYKGTPELYLLSLLQYATGAKNKEQKQKLGIISVWKVKKINAQAMTHLVTILFYMKYI